MAGSATTFDEYLAGVEEEKRAALQKLRTTIKSIVPEAEECISYGLAAFRLDGKPLVALGATPNHCAFYLMSGTMVESFRADLEGYDTSKGTVRFSPERPLPVTLVRKLVKARVAENAAVLAKAKSRSAKKPRGEEIEPQTDPAVVEFLRDLEHPLKKEIEAVRKIILGVSPDIREGIKWKSPSFRTTEYFATINLRSEDQVQVILHLGAKVKDNSTSGLTINDPSGLIKWLAKDRAMVTLGAGKEIRGRQPAFEAIIRAWIEQM